VADWQAAGPYSGIDEFVESIPFTQTREYVEAILRNEETYRAIDDFCPCTTVRPRRPRPVRRLKLSIETRNGKNPTCHSPADDSH
jgi:hypothetical protein